MQIIQKNLNRLLQIIDGLQNTIDQDPDVVVSADVIDLEKISTAFMSSFILTLKK